ncbi:MAG: PD40 domain-containing protein [Bdellovibrionales bacterium]|nr:PD40 domain-containing protein [Bdellovibrionales bacterium]
MIKPLSVLIGLFFASAAFLPQAVARPEVGFSGLGEQLGFSPFRDWKTLNTNHFRITYPQELQELADLAAKNLEESHRLLSPLLQWTPRLRTQVVLIDNSDFANGLTAATLRLGIVLWATPPDNWSSIAHYDDWFRLLCLHEYAHFLNLDATRDFWSVLRMIAGDSTLPNSLWPAWMLEGLAVTIETAFTQSGRGRSSYYSMILRAAEESGRLQQISSLGGLTGPRTESPGGEIPYLFGYQLMAKLSSESLDLLGDLSTKSSQSLPWKLNSYAESVSGKDWNTHWKEWVLEAGSRARSEIAAVRSSGETSTQNITHQNVSTLGIAFSPDGKWMAYSKESQSERQGVYLRSTGADHEQRISDQIGGASMGFTTDSQALVFSRVDRHGLYDFYSDLWIYDLSKKNLSRLSFGKRFRDPSSSMGSDWIVFTANEAGRTSLARARLTRDSHGGYFISDEQILYRPSLMSRVSTPRISSDGKRVIFSLHENGKPGESIFEAVIRGADVGASTDWQVKQLTSDTKALDRFPFFDRAGTVYFVSNRSGIDNIYRWDANTGSTSAITNVTTGLWLPAISQEGRLAASLYRSSGWDVVWVETDLSKSMVLPVFEAPLPARPKESSVVSGSQNTITESQTVSDYSIFPSILPRTWAPYFSYGTEAGWTLGALLLGFDALDLHRYLAILEARPSLGEWGGGLSYSNRVLGAAWTLSGSRRVESLFEQVYTRKSEAGLGLSLYYPRTYSVWNPSLEFSWEKDEVLAYPAMKGALGSGTLQTRRSAPTFSAELNYSGALSSRQSIWPEEGFRTRLGNKWSLGGWLGSLEGQRRTTTQALWIQSHYFNLGNHVVLSPRWQVALSNRPELQLAGRSGGVFDAIGESSFDSVVIRGYPKTFFSAKQAAVTALDLRFPIRRVERGWHTYPVFLESIQGLAFLESSVRRRESVGSWRGTASYGAGLLADFVLFYSAPVSASVQFHQGTKMSAGGRPEVFLDLRLGQLFF